MFVILTYLCFLFAGLFGLYNTTFGLEMSDVLPDQTAPAAFLKARDRYFSFYPMFAVLRGPGIDYAKNQQKIDNYRLSIGKLLLFLQKRDSGSKCFYIFLNKKQIFLGSLDRPEYV